MTTGRQIHFNSCIDWLDLAWRTPGENPVRRFDMDQLTERAMLAEAGLMDAMFIADFYTYRPGVSLEPLTLLAALAGVTRHIGLIASVSTTYNEPWNLARMFASLDHLSKGRAGWNMVTTAVGTVAQNYSRDSHMEHDTRYARADEFVDVVTRLWDSWDEDALVLDRGRGLFLDPAKVHPLNHHGAWFDLAGPLDIPRPPQGSPVRMQAGSSEAGRDFGARWAEVIFTAQPILPIAQDFYRDVKSRAAALGRGPDEIRILPGLMPVVCESRAEAEEFLASRAARRGRGEPRLKEFIGVDVGELPPDEPIPLGLLPAHGSTNGMRGRADLMLDIIRRYRLTPRQVMSQEAHHAFAGTPKETADLITEWFEAGACDGFTLMWPSLAANELFVRAVVPILQARGLYRRAYSGATLREHFGLRRPPWRNPRGEH